MLDVLEVEAQTPNDALLKWLEGLHTIDGVIICFDYSDMSSWQPVEGLLSQYNLQKSAFIFSFLFLQSITEAPQCPSWFLDVNPTSSAKSTQTM